MALRYWECAPDARLRPWVEAICFSRSLTVEQAREAVRVVPDGTADLLLTLAVDRDGRAEGGCRAELFGVKSRALLLEGQAPAYKLGVRLRPGVLGRLAGTDASELRDRSVDLSDLWGRRGHQLEDAVAGCADAGELKRRVEQAIGEHLALVAPEPGAVWAGRLAQAILASRGRARIAEIARGAGLGERRLERLFRRHVGLSAKGFSRVVRFRCAWEQLAGGRRQVEAALECGYSDQSHMVRDFRALAGIPPGELF